MDNIDLPKLSDHQQCLNSDITIRELETVLQQMKLGKSQGFESLTIEFYRTFNNELMSYLEELSLLFGKGRNTVFMESCKVGFDPENRDRS